MNVNFDYIFFYIYVIYIIYLYTVSTYTDLEISTHNRFVKHHLTHPTLMSANRTETIIFHFNNDVPIKA